MLGQFLTLDDGDAVRAKRLDAQGFAFVDRPSGCCLRHVRA